MAVLSTRVPDEVAARFELAARPFGGRSALLARLAAAAAGGGGEPSEDRPPASRSAAAPRPARLMVRLSAADAAAVDLARQARGLSRSGWVAGLVGAHLLGRPCLARDDARALLAIHGELRRIGVNLNQIARALNTAVLEGRVLELETVAVADLRAELRAQMGGLRAAVAGDLAAWKTVW